MPPEDAEATLAYWTEERCRNAVPVEPPSEDVADPAESGEIDRSAPPQRSEPYRGDDPAPPIAEPATPAVFTTQLVPNPGAFPHRCVGRLMFRLNGADRFGSAAVVNRFGIMTAAHCVFDPATGDRATGLAFAPAFTDGISRDYGLWTIPYMHVPDAWRTPPVMMHYDFSFGRVTPRGSVEVGDVVGWLALVVDHPQNAYWDDEGYPGTAIPGYAFDGQRLWNCDGARTQLIGQTIRKQGNFTGGASGGPWIVRADDGTYCVNGLDSAKYGNPPDENGSPYFRGAVMDLYRVAFP